MDHGDIIHKDKPNNESFKNKIENIQYKAMHSNQEQFKGHPGSAFIKS